MVKTIIKIWWIIHFILILILFPLAKNNIFLVKLFYSVLVFQFIVCSVCYYKILTIKDYDKDT